MKNKIYTVHTHNEEETRAFARSLAERLYPGQILLLYGDLGMGKTVFSRALIRCLCEDEDMDVPSPTFTLVQTYDSKKGMLWHFDLYRLCDPSEVYELGWEEALGEEGCGAVIVEWPERLGDLIPAQATHIRISAIKDNPQARIIEVEEP